MCVDFCAFPNFSYIIAFPFTLHIISFFPYKYKLFNADFTNLNSNPQLIDIVFENSDTEKSISTLNGEYLTEEHAIITTVGKKKYYEGIQSFFQVNNTLTKLLYDEVLNEVKENAYQNVLDLMRSILHNY